MSDIVTGTPAVVGFTNGRDNYCYNHGISDKDQQFAVDIENNERTRDTLSAIYATNVNVEKNGAAAVLATSVASMATQLGIEKTSAATQLAVEKIGAAGILEAAKNTATIQLQANLNTSQLQLQAALLSSESRLEASRVAAASALAAAQNQAALAAQIAECCCEQKALALEIEARGTRDKLQLLQTQFLILSGGGITPAVRALA